jgi:hypothetical protein
VAKLQKETARNVADVGGPWRQWRPRDMNSTKEHLAIPNELVELQKLISEDKWKDAWARLLALLPECVECRQTLAMFSAQPYPQDPPQFVCDACLKELPEDEGDDFRQLRPLVALRRHRFASLATRRKCSRQALAVAPEVKRDALRR